MNFSITVVKLPRKQINMNVKQGDSVLVDGQTSVVETSWGQGKHKVFKLADGRQVLDLDKLVIAGKVAIVPAVVPAPLAVPIEEPKKLWKS